MPAAPPLAALPAPPICLPFYLEPAAGPVAAAAAAAAAAVSLRLSLRAQQRVLNLCLLKGLGPQHAARTLAARLRPVFCTRVGEVPGRAYLCTGVVDRQGTGSVRAVPANGAPCMPGCWRTDTVALVFSKCSKQPSRCCTAIHARAQPARSTHSPHLLPHLDDLVLPQRNQRHQQRQRRLQGLQDAPPGQGSGAWVSGVPHTRLQGSTAGHRPPSSARNGDKQQWIQSTATTISYKQQ